MKLLLPGSFRRTQACVCLSKQCANKEILSHWLTMCSRGLVNKVNNCILHASLLPPVCTPLPVILSCGLHCFKAVRDRALDSCRVCAGHVKRCAVTCAGSSAATAERAGVACSGGQDVAGTGCSDKGSIGDQCRYASRHGFWPRGTTTHSQQGMEIWSWTHQQNIRAALLKHICNFTQKPLRFASAACMSAVLMWVLWLYHGIAPRQ